VDGFLLSWFKASLRHMEITVNCLCAWMWGGRSNVVSFLLWKGWTWPGVHSSF